jgi:iron(III) transport system permease protein
MGIAVWVGYARGRAGRRAGAFTDVLLVVLFAVPSTVVGVGLIGVWNRAGVVGDLYGTDGMLLLGYLARFLPVAALAMAAGIRYVPVSHEEAAAVGGAGWWRTMVRVVLPQTTPALLVTWAVVFVLAFGELGASILVAPPGESTLPIRIYTIIANAPPAEVAALALLQSAVVLAPLALLAFGVGARRTR